MNAEKYSRSLNLICSTCGGGQFEYDPEDDGPIRCGTCDRIFTRDELLRENGPVIEAGVDEMKEEVVADLKKELHESLRKALAGSKFISFR